MSWFYTAEDGMANLGVGTSPVVVCLSSESGLFFCLEGLTNKVVIDNIVHCIEEFCDDCATLLLYEGRVEEILAGLVATADPVKTRNLY